MCVKRKHKTAVWSGSIVKSGRALTATMIRARVGVALEPLQLLAHLLDLGLLLSCGHGLILLAAGGRGDRCVGGLFVVVFIFDHVGAGLGAVGLDKLEEVAQDEIGNLVDVEFELIIVYILKVKFVSNASLAAQRKQNINRWSNDPSKQPLVRFVVEYLVVQRSKQ